MSGWIGIVFLAGLAAAADVGSHKAPAQSLASPAADDRRAILAEMWHRGLVSAERNSWSPQEMALLERMRQAEVRGAVGLLRRHVTVWRGLVVRDQSAGSMQVHVRLTRRGFDQYLRLKSQEALDYFASKEIETKWAYGLTDQKGRALFDQEKGLLTDAGDELYSRVLLNQPVFWRTRDGSVMGNRPLPAK
jgi:hypothetical protein